MGAVGGGKGDSLLSSSGHAENMISYRSWPPLIAVGENIETENVSNT